MKIGPTSAVAVDMVLGAVQAPFTYEARPPADILFVPLKQQQEFNAAALLQVPSYMQTLLCDPWYPVPAVVAISMRIKCCAASSWHSHTVRDARKASCKRLMHGSVVTDILEKKLQADLMQGCLT